MPGLFGETGLPIVDTLSRAGGALLRPNFEEKYGADIAAIDAEKDPDARMRRIAEVGRRAGADGYSLKERTPLTTRADQTIDESLKNPDRSAGILDAARYTQLLGRSQTPMGGMTNLATILQKGAAAAYTAGPKTQQTQAETEFITGPKTRQATTAATRNVAQAGAAGAAAGLSGARTVTENQMRPGRVALVGEQADRTNALAQQALQPKRKTFRATVVNPITQKPEVVLFDENGQQVQTLGEAPPHAQGSGAIFIDAQGNIRLGGAPAPDTGIAPPPPPPPPPPPAGQSTEAPPTPDEIAKMRAMGVTDEDLRAEGWIP
jgi:hypothetical protein